MNLTSAASLASLSGYRPDRQKPPDEDLAGERWKPQSRARSINRKGWRGLGILLGFLIVFPSISLDLISPK